MQESRWHGSQKLTTQPDGSLIAEFSLPDTQEIKRWIMSFGPNAKVLGPEALVEEIANDLQRMLWSNRNEDADTQAIGSNNAT